MKVIELTNEQYDELLANGEIIVNGEVKPYEEDQVLSGELIYLCPALSTWIAVTNKLDAVIYDTAAARTVTQDVVDNIYENLINDLEGNLNENLGGNE